MSVVALLVAVVALAVGAAGCTSSSGRRAGYIAGRAPAGSRAGSALPRAPASSRAASSSPASSSAGTHRPAPSRSAPSRSAPGRSAAPPQLELPRGGRRIIGHYRVVAYYGAAGAPVLGVLGQGPPETQAAAVIRRAGAYKGYGLPVQPAMELIATVAQGAPGPDGDYSRPVPLDTVRTYLAVAHRHRMLLILDLQPGRSTFLAQARALRSVLLDPSVGLALDPEWKVTDGQRPGDGLIGSSGSGDINATIGWLSRLVTTHGLPDKLLAVHEFTSSMLPDRGSIRRQPGVEVTFHADGFGTQGAKMAVYRKLAFPPHPFGAGFKLFIVHDRDLMSPAQVMALSPRPDMVTYQ